MGGCQFFDIILIGAFKGLTVVAKGEGGQKLLKFVDIINDRPQKVVELPSKVLAIYFDN